MRAYTAGEAESAVRQAIAGQGTPRDAEILVDLFRRSAAQSGQARAAAKRKLAVIEGTVVSVVDEPV